MRAAYPWLVVVLGAGFLLALYVAMSDGLDWLVDRIVGYKIPPVAEPVSHVSVLDDRQAS